MAEKTTKMDLTVDHTVNGVSYPAGKGVEVHADHADGLKEAEQRWADHRSDASTHHGAVPVAADPMEATAQTPTRPLGGEHVRMEQVVDPAESVEVKNAEVVKDPNEDGDKGTDLAKK